MLKIRCQSQVHTRTLLQLKQLMQCISLRKMKIVSVIWDSNFLHLAVFMRYWSSVFKNSFSVVLPREIRSFKINHTICLCSITYSAAFPVKNLSSLLTHCKLTWKLTATSFWSHSSTTQLTHETISHCDLAVNPPWVCNSHHELAVSYSWDLPICSPCSGSSELTVISLLISRWDIHCNYE